MYRRSYLLQSPVRVVSFVPFLGFGASLFLAQMEQAHLIWAFALYLHTVRSKLVRALVSDICFRFFPAFPKTYSRDIFLFRNLSAYSTSKCEWLMMCMYRTSADALSVILTFASVVIIGSFPSSEWKKLRLRWVIKTQVMRVGMVYKVKPLSELLGQR